MIRVLLVEADDRDEWIAADLPGWLNVHTFYPDSLAAAKAISAAGVDFYVITTKAKSFTLRLAEAAGLSLRPEQVFGLGSGPKAEVLEALLRNGSYSRCCSPNQLGKIG